MHYEALQLVLKAQVEVLVNQMLLPPELELIVRDLWLLHVTALQVQLPATAGPKFSDVEMADNVETEEELLVRGAVRESQKNDADSEVENEGLESEVEKGGLKRRTKPSKKGKGTPRMEWTAAILYLACKWLRLPIMMGDLHVQICNGTLPYLNAEKTLPASIMERLYAKRFQSFHIAVSFRCKRNTIDPEMHTKT